MKPNNQLIKGFYLNIIILQLIFLSFAAVFHKLEPIILGGASLFFIIIPYVLMFFVFLNNLGKISTREVQLLIVIIFLAFLIMFIRTIVYDDILLKSVSSGLYVIFIPTMFLILKNTYIPPSKYSLIRRTILIVIGFNFLNSVLYLMGLEFFETKFEDSDKYIAFSRFSGLFGGPNISSNIVLLMTILYVLTAEKLKESSALIMSIIFFITVLPNLSRGPIFIYIIFLIIYVIKVLKIKFNFVNVSFLIVSLLGVLFFLSYFLENSEVDSVYNSFLNRAEELDGKYGRMDRFYLAIKLIFEDFNAMLIGIKTSKQTVSEVFSISDNSLTLFLANFGIPFTVLFIYFITKNINFYKITKSKKQVFTLAVVLMGVFNNAVIWTAWPFFVILGYKLLSIDEKLNQEKKITIQNNSIILNEYNLNHR